MTHTLTTTIDIPTVGTDVEVEVDYTYYRRTQELVISAVVAKIDGHEMPVWHLLPRDARWKLEERCVDHAGDVKQAAVEQRWEETSGR